MRSRAFQSSEARVVLSGLAFPKSPRWRDGRLWICNWAAQEIVAVNPEGGSEGMHFIFKLPSVEEAATIRHFVGLAKRRVLSEAELERLRQTGFRSGGAQTSEKQSRTIRRLPTYRADASEGKF